MIPSKTQVSIRSMCFEIARTSIALTVDMTFSSYLKTAADIGKMVRGARLCMQIAQAQPLSAHLDHTEKREDLDQRLYEKTDEELANSTLR